MRKRDAMREAHSQAAAVLRQYAEQQGGYLGFDDDEVEDQQLRDALFELANRHDRTANRQSRGSAA